MLKNYRQEFIDIDHNLSSQMSKLLSMDINDIKFLPQTSKAFEIIKSQAKKSATINFVKDNIKYNLELLTYFGVPLILDDTTNISYLVIRSIDIV